MQNSTQWRVTKHQVAYGAALELVFMQLQVLGKFLFLCSSMPLGAWIRQSNYTWNSYNDLAQVCLLAATTELSSHLHDACQGKRSHRRLKTFSRALEFIKDAWISSFIPADQIAFHELV